MDELDRKIVRLLQLDCRVSNPRIARQVGVSEYTVRRRIRRLRQEGAIHVIVVPDLEWLGHATTVLVGLRTDPGTADAVAEAIANLAEIHYVAVTAGGHDVFFLVGLESLESLGAFLRTKIGVIEGVLHAETFVNVAIKKRTNGLVL